MLHLVKAIAGACAVLVMTGCGSAKTDWPCPASGPAVEEARRLLAEAGYPFGRGFPPTELLYNESESHKKIAAAVQEMWRRNLGIEITLRNIEWKVYLDHLSRVDYQIARRGWVADYLHPNTFLDMFTGRSGNNNTAWAEPRYDALIGQAARTGDLEAQMKILGDAEDLLLKELPVVPVYHNANQSLWRASIQGLHDNLLNVHPLKDVVLGDGSKPFVMNLGAEPQTLDPNLLRGQVEHRVTIGLFEGLTTYHPRTLEPQPGAAERWTRSEDGRTWTFHLRPASWSNGRPVTAHDFVYGWRRQIDPLTASDYAYIATDFLKNAKSWYQGASADLSLKDYTGLPEDKRAEAARALVDQVQARHIEPLKKALAAEKAANVRAILERALQAASGRPDVKADDIGVRALDDRTLQVELVAATPFFLHLTSFFAYFPIPREAVEKHGHRWTRPENIVTNGPYVLAEWVSNGHLLLERNPKYWDAANVRQKQMRLLPLTNANTALNMYRSGQCDYIDAVPLEFVEVLQKDPEYHTAPMLGTYFYSFNVLRPPFDDPRVRRALALAIDRETICGKILRGGQIPAYGMVPPGLEGYRGRSFATK